MADDVLAAIGDAAADLQLDIFGAFHPAPGDLTPEGTGTLLLLGPREPGFWAYVTACAEFADGRGDPLDRWSRRAIGDLARAVGGTPLFPFTGPPYLPFWSWALRSGRAWASPIRLLVHDTAGLMVSYRGAITLGARLHLPQTPANAPCNACDARPCISACPVGALTGNGYDTDACHAHLRSPSGDDCLSRGCAVRRSCPVSRSHGRLEAQSAWHMRRFHPA